ncbi:hypothetical protein RSOLAG1IB_08313 [Rhizoctonia solani AG-1 IB]|uniref:Uncharacterized protein n=1 Tax=Thanatephorus cucumeris (strain AG1-IB / isolate 7/3/14) TaxID=1108050 RepID=A0A0B7FHH7_THACB|nr:hypothetical protein RSOLAG1IB_08313 [Rhizoctonia solani AG-1 IB]
MSQLAVFSSPGILSELSIHFSGDYDQIISLPTQHQDRFNQILGSLSSLKLRNAYIDLFSVSFTGLVELRLERLELGSPLMFERLLRAISSALNLQYLGLANVSSERNPDMNSLDNSGLSVSFPKLKTVYLSGIWFSDLEMIVKSFVSGNEEWIIHIQEVSLYRNVPGIYPEATHEELASLLQGLNVVTLIIEGRSDGSWIDPAGLSRILTALPTITTLELNSWTFFREHWEALVRVQSPIEAENIKFPLLREFYAHKARIFDNNGIHTVISSHNIQKLRLTGLLCTEEGGIGKLITDEDDIATRLASNIADFSLTESRYHPCEALEKLYNVL